MNLSAGRGIAVREFKLTTGCGFADYLMFLEGKAVGVLEAKARRPHLLRGRDPRREVFEGSSCLARPAGFGPRVLPWLERDLEPES